MKNYKCKICGKSIANQSGSYTCLSCNHLSEHYSESAILELFKYSEKEDLTREDWIYLSRLRNPPYDMDNTSQRSMLRRTMRLLGYSGNNCYWRKLKQDSYNIHVRARRAMLRSKPIDENHCCEICCSETNLQVHHKLPVSLGGKNEPDNIQILCAGCHKKAHQKIRSILSKLVKDNLSLFGL